MDDWHKETWEEVENVLREHFTDLGFRVDQNHAVGTVTIISGRKALTVMNTTGSHFDGQDRLILPAFK